MEKMSSSSDDSSDSVKKAYKNEVENDIEEITTTVTALATPGSTGGLAATSNHSVALSARSLMKSKKETDTYDLAEDVYAFIFVAPVLSLPFFFSFYVIAIKIIIYSILFTDIHIDDVTGASQTATAAKFFLIPVALSMQGDLMHSFFCMANLNYCPQVLKVSKSATKTKLLLSFLLRTIDGMFSLAVNFALMLTTQSTLSVFTNFAALYFLQDIDDVFYGLVELGFFGDLMEHWSTVCKSVTLPRRTGADNRKCGFLRISHLDSIMFALFLVILLIGYFGYLGYIYYLGGFDSTV